MIIDMVERVARAVYASNCWWRIVQREDDGKGRYRDGVGGERFRAVTWEELGAGEKILLLESARDHIVAMRNPTEDMVECARDPRTANGSPVSKGVHDTWQAMIDRALAEPKP